MTVSLLAFRVALAIVFGVAALAKLADLADSRRAIRDFGVPARLVSFAGTALPLGEFAIALLLLPASTARFGALGALALLLTFCAAIGVNLARGRKPDCHCFGQLHSEPAGAKTLARNLLLAALAAFVAVAARNGAGPSALAWIGRLDSSQLAVVAAFGVMAIVLSVGATVVMYVLRSHGTLLLRIDRLEKALREAGIDPSALDRELPALGLPPGSPAPSFTLSAIDGRDRRLEDLIARGARVLLLFTDASCGPCRALLPTAARWQHKRDFTLVVASAGDRAAAASEAARHGLEIVLLDPDRKVYEAYRAAGTPSAVLIAPDGTIASPLAGGQDDIERLVARYSMAQPTSLPIGTRAPDIVVDSVEGERIALAQLRGRDAVLVFWNPACSHCRSLHAQLVEHERRRDDLDARIVIVSSGDRGAVHAEGFRSLVLLDPAFAVGSSFGAAGTPSAVALDGHGRVASPVGTGKDGVLSLLASRIVPITASAQSER